MKQTNSQHDFLKRAGLGVAAAWGASALMCGLLGLLVSKEVLPLHAAPVAAVVLSGLALFAACYLVARTAAKSRLPIALGMALAFSLLSIAIRAAAIPSQPMTFGWTTAVPFLAAAAAGLLSSKRKVRRH